ncbi:uncharacterized protein EI90DRAFT_3075155, partial [Cantharellus anzutake]|uniref:uncharacterized protein n=1 Tax=Cantharellus anzutake TaxID=1750568 RepID=UPI001904FEE1
MVWHGNDDLYISTTLGGPAKQFFFFGSRRIYCNNLKDLGQRKGINDVFVQALIC